MRVCFCGTSLDVQFGLGSVEFRGHVNALVLFFVFLKAFLIFSTWFVSVGLFLVELL